MGRDSGVVCEARVVMRPSPGLRRVRHVHAAVFSHATEVTSLRTTRPQGTVKRRYCVQTEPSLASNLFVTLPCCIAPRRVLQPLLSAQLCDAISCAQRR
jgi:hypothetical protein